MEVALKFEKLVSVIYVKYRSYYLIESNYDIESESFKTVFYESNCDYEPVKPLFEIRANTRDDMINNHNCCCSMIVIN